MAMDRRMPSFHLVMAICVTLLVTLPPQFSFGDYEIPLEARPTKSGYLNLNTSTASRLFYAYYEALEPADDLSQTPIILWLQASTYRPNIV